MPLFYLVSLYTIITRAHCPNFVIYKKNEGEKIFATIVNKLSVLKFVPL